LPNGLFENLYQLNVLDLSVNQIRRLPVDILKGFGNLYNFDLTGNKISELPKNFFKGYRGSRNLYINLSQNKKMKLGRRKVPVNVRIEMEDEELSDTDEDFENSFYYDEDFYGDDEDHYTGDEFHHDEDYEDFCTGDDYYDYPMNPRSEN